MRDEDAEGPSVVNIFVRLNANLDFPVGFFFFFGTPLITIYQQNPARLTCVTETWSQ